jgi:hypothetical protein
VTVNVVKLRISIAPIQRGVDRITSVSCDNHSGQRGAK